MSEPWGMYGDPSELGLPAPWVAREARAEAAEIAREQRAADERRVRAEERHEQALWRAAMQAMAEGRQVDLNDPSTYVLSPDELASRVFAEQDREAAWAERKALIEAGLLHVINIPPDEMGPPPPPSDAQLAEKAADAECKRAERRTRQAGIIAKARHALAKVGRPS